MARLGTYCSQCRFYKAGDCQKGLIDKFKSAGADVEVNENGHIIDRVCVHRRTHDWEPDLNDDEASQKVNEEIFVRGSIVLVIETLDGLYDTLLILKDKQYDNFSLLFAYTQGVTYSSIKNIVNQSGIKNNHIYVKVFANSYDGQIIDEAFRQAKNGFLISLDPSKSFDPDIAIKLDKFVNHEMQKFFYIEPIIGSHHQSVQIAALHNYLKGNKMFSFKDKVIELSDESFVKTWENVNEYTC